MSDFWPMFDLAPRAPLQHNLKCHPEAFLAVWERKKPYEIRRADRDFQVGDSVILEEWDPALGHYTGWRVFIRQITYITRGPAWGIPKGLCVFGFDMGQTSRSHI